MLVNHKNIKMNERNHHGISALHWAVNEQRIDIIKIFIKQKNIDVNIKDNNDQTPLIIAA